MTTAEIRKKILVDDELVQNHIEQILVWYNLKRTIRYNETRTVDAQSESVAEHVYGMQLLCDYFLPLEIIDLNHNTIRHLITWHDMAEALVGDMTSESKTEEHKTNELQAEETLVANAPSHLTKQLQSTFADYNNLTTKEAQFVRALDKLEPLFHLIFISRQPGFRPFQWGWTAQEDKDFRRPYIEKFGLLQRFDDVLSYELDTAGYFIES